MAAAAILEKFQMVISRNGSYDPHSAVIFAIAQLSCLHSTCAASCQPVELVGNPGCQHCLATSFQLVRLVGCGLHTQCMAIAVLRGLGQLSAMRYVPGPCASLAFCRVGIIHSFILPIVQKRQ